MEVWLQKIFVEEVSGTYFVNGKKVNLKNLIEDSLKSGKYVIINRKIKMH